VITCKEAVDGLWEYLDKNLGKVSESEIEEHLGLCRHCCGELEFAKQLREALRQPAPTARLTADAQSRLETFLRHLAERV
jgi:hypothetical protein